MPEYSEAVDSNQPAPLVISLDQLDSAVDDASSMFNRLMVRLEPIRSPSVPSENKSMPGQDVPMSSTVVQRINEMTTQIRRLHVRITSTLDELDV